MIHLEYKEFKCIGGPVDEQMNTWISKNPDIFIMDTKYAADSSGSYALIYFQRGERICNTHIAE